MKTPDIPVVTESEKEELEHRGILKKEDAKVVVPESEECEKILRRIRPERYGEKRRFCGDCEYFTLAEGQEELNQKEELWLGLFKELEHDPMWYGSQEGYGLCLAIDGHMTHNTAPCMIPMHYVDSSAPYELKDEPVDCPQYKPGQSWRKRIKSYKGSGGDKR